MQKQTNLMAFALLLMLVLGCGMMKNIAKRNSADFNPYKGKVEDLLPKEMSTGDIKFKFVVSVRLHQFLVYATSRGRHISFACFREASCAARLYCSALKR